MALLAWPLLTPDLTNTRPYIWGLHLLSMVYHLCFGIKLCWALGFKKSKCLSQSHHHQDVLFKIVDLLNLQQLGNQEVFIFRCKSTCSGLLAGTVTIVNICPPLQGRPQNVERKVMGFGALEYGGCPSLFPGLFSMQIQGSGPCDEQS